MHLRLHFFPSRLFAVSLHPAACLACLSCPCRQHLLRLRLSSSFPVREVRPGTGFRNDYGRCCKQERTHPDVVFPLDCGFHHRNVAARPSYSFQSGCCHRILPRADRRTGGTKRTSINWWDFAKRYAAQTSKCPNVSVGTILLTDEHICIWISVVENRNDFQIYLPIQSINSVNQNP